MTGWSPVDGDLDTWRNEAGDVLSTHYFPQPPDLPAPLGDMDSIRSAYRRLLRKRGAIIELEAEHIGNYHALRAIFKIAREANRMMYMAVLMFPFPPVLRNRSEDAEWDALFPDHPLSRARSHTQCTLLQAELPASVRQLPPFDGPSTLPRAPDE